jgi:DNA-directed RNA polymerase subunit RPC12/RpoP
MTIEFRCAQCRQLLQVPLATTGQHARCPQCRQLMLIPASQPVAKPIPPPPLLLADDDRPGLPWEQAQGSVLQRFWQTSLLISFQPTTAFAQMQRRGSFTGPIVYSAWGLALGAVANLVWSMPTTYLQSLVLPLPPGGIASALSHNLLITFATGLATVVLGSTVFNFLSAAVMHLCVVLTGGSKQPFDTSFRICAYTQASLAWLQWIPLVGSLAMTLWTIAASIIAVQQAHEVSPLRACVIVLLPMAVCGGLVVLLLVLFFALALGLQLRTPA